MSDLARCFLKSICAAAQLCVLFWTSRLSWHCCRAPTRLFVTGVEPDVAFQACRASLCIALQSHSSFLLLGLSARDLIRMKPQPFVCFWWLSYHFTVIYKITLCVSGGLQFISLIYIILVLHLSLTLQILMPAERFHSAMPSHSRLPVPGTKAGMALSWGRVLGCL